MSAGRGPSPRRPKGQQAARGQALGLAVGFGLATQALSSGLPASGQSSELCGHLRLHTSRPGV